MTARAQLQNARRVVVKVGSQLLADDPQVFARVAKDLAQLREHGTEPVLVSSGAIALGLGPLGLDRRPTDVAGLQAAAAAGQARLMRRWMLALEEDHALVTAQVLLTHGDLGDRRRYLNARAALQRLLQARVMPIINENDTVSVEEIKLGDNDVLAAEVCGLVDAEAVVLLTSSDGLMTADPRQDKTAERIALIQEIDDDVRARAEGRSPLGTGGMTTKLRAAEIAAAHGARTLIVPGRADGALWNAMQGQDVGTLIDIATQTPQKARKRWIGLTLRPRGRLVLDDGAVQAVADGASLLPVGVKRVEGTFSVGDCVELVTDAGRVVARGLVRYTSKDAALVAGKRSEQAQEALHGPAPDVVVHRDDLVPV